MVGEYREALGGLVRCSLVHVSAPVEYRRVHVGASYSPAHFLSPSPFFQGENLLYCFEVAPTQPALTQGKQVPSHSYLPRGGCLAPHPTATLPVPQ